MATMISLVLAALFFLAIHLLVSGTALRGRLMAVAGEAKYMAGFSIASAIGIVWLVIAFNHAPYVGLWTAPAGLLHLAPLTVLVAFFLVVTGLTTPNPTAVKGERLVAVPPRGIVRICRHPFLWGVALWALTHAIANGELGALIFFGTFLILGVAGPFSIDAKRRLALGPAWTPFAAATSNFPFVAIIERRNRLALSEIAWWQWLAVLVLYGGVFASHRWLFGVSPLPG